MSLSKQTKEKLKKLYKRCRTCHSKEDIEYHHLIPDAKDIKFNLIPLCHKCHKRLELFYDKKIASAIKKQIALYKQQVFDNGLIKPSAHTDQILFNKFAALKKDIIFNFNELKKQLKEKA